MLLEVLFMWAARCRFVFGALVVIAFSTKPVQHTLAYNIFFCDALVPCIGLNLKVSKFCSFEPNVVFYFICHQLTILLLFVSILMNKISYWSFV